MYHTAALLILAGASMAVAQDVPPTPLDSNTSASAEQAAIRYALDSVAANGSGRVVINPMIAPNAAAPGRGEALRPIWRTDKLAAFLKAPSRMRDSVINCASRTSLGPRCDFLDADSYVTASDPRFDGGLATVTVTIEQRGSRGLIYYRTYNIVMTNTSNGWKVMKFELLGIS